VLYIKYFMDVIGRLKLGSFSEIGREEAYGSQEKNGGQEEERGQEAEAFPIDKG
jgi:hypothetical protein